MGSRDVAETPMPHYSDSITIYKAHEVVLVVLNCFGRVEAIEQVEQLVLRSFNKGRKRGLWSFDIVQGRGIEVVFEKLFGSIN